MEEINKKHRGHKFMPPKAELAKIPPLYAQEDKGKDAIVYAHYFTRGGAGDWYVTELDPTTGTAFGLVRLLDEELGYFTLQELEQVRVGIMLIERDMYWTPRPLREV